MVHNSSRLLSALALLLLVACTTSEGVIEGPRLIREVTLPPVTVAPSRVVSPSAVPTSAASPTEPLDVATASEPFALDVTPTSPPSKTPTVTPSFTVTEAATATAPATPTADDRPQPEPTLAVLVPTMVFMPPQTPEVVAQAPDLAQASPSGDVSLPLPGVPDVPAAACSLPWFFTRPALPDCPLEAAVESPAAAQFFQYGKMYWVGAQTAIYVLYEDQEQPRWQVFRDTYEDGMPDSDPALDAQAPDYHDFQPRRGFGLVWRTQPDVMRRIGWAESAYEQSYTVLLQTRSDGTVFLSDPNGRVYALQAGGRDWQTWTP